jgi:hypothetical protein
MNEPEKTTSQDRRSQLSLKSLFLDPNNYRFIDSENYVRVAEDATTNTDVQRRTTALILGKNGENVRDLVDSFRKNGFLPVDLIQVRRLGDSGRFLVVEGNRRVAALKYLQSRHESDEALDLGRLDPEIFAKVPVVYYTDADESHHLVLMGLKHISGNKKWPAINQAELIRTLHYTHEMQISDICQSIGITQQEVKSTLQTLAFIDAYKASDYGDQFQSDKYSIFREVIKNRRLRLWLQWDDAQQVALNKPNQERLFSWVSEESILDEEDEDSTGELIGNRQKLEPVLVKSAQIRDLAKIIDDENALTNLETTRNLTEATLSSEVLGKDKVKNAIAIIAQETNAIFNMSRLIADADRAEIKHLEDKLKILLTLGQTQSMAATSRSSYLDVTVGSKLSRIDIKNFRQFNNISIENLGRINLIAGINNSGKTTFLEAVKLLCSLNDSKEFIDLVRRRAKATDDQVEMAWFLEQFPNCRIEGTYNEKAVALVVEREQQQLEDMTHYLSTTCFDAKFDNAHWTSQVHFFEKYPQRTEGPTSSICPSVFSSPFNGLELELLKDCHGKSLKEGSKELVIDFIRENIDPGIRNIEHDDRGHFTVIHDKISPNPDISMFGEGLQRIFKIGLLFAGAKDGVLIIDEFENAIHASLLHKVADLLFKLAVMFNVQVFISSHSKECIDAFALSNEIPREHISAYALVKTDSILKCHYFSGNRLHNLIETINFDLRGKGSN